MNNVLSIEKMSKKHKNYKGNYCSTAQKSGHDVRDCVRLLRISVEVCILLYHIRKKTEKRCASGRGHAAFFQFFQKTSLGRIIRRWTFRNQSSSRSRFLHRFRSTPFLRDGRQGSSLRSVSFCRFHHLRCIHCRGTWLRFCWIPRRRMPWRVRFCKDICCCRS